MKETDIREIDHWIGDVTLWVISKKGAVGKGWSVLGFLGMGGEELEAKVVFGREVALTEVLE